MAAAAGRGTTVARVCAVLALIAAVVVLIAVVSAAPRRDGLSVPTDARVVAAPRAIFATDGPAAVRAVRHGSLVCFLTADDRGDRLVFPPGYSASPDLHLRDDRGDEVATPGSAVGIAFADVPVTAPAVCGSTGRALAVTRIASLRG